MKLLLLTPQLPYPPRQGTTMRNFYLIRELASRHSVHLLSFLASGETLAPQSPLHRLCASITTLPQPHRSTADRARDTLLSPLPDMALRLHSPTMLQVVRQAVAQLQPHLVQIEGIEMAPCGLALAAEPMRPVLVFDNHNVEYLLQKRMALMDLPHPRRWLGAAYSLVQWRKLQHYEAQVCRAVDAVIAVSSVDQAALARLAPEIPVAVVPNGLALETYQAASATPQPGPGQPANLVFTGKMDYRPNVDAALWFGSQVLPRIQAQMPQVRFQIVGSNPHPRLEPLRANPAIEITGSVPEVQPYLQGAAVYLVPLRVGGGTRFKVLEAMACAKPIVSTSLGVEGIPVTEGQELLLADTPATFAARVVYLLQDADARAALGRAAHRFVHTHYGWEQLTPSLERLYETLLGTRPEGKRTP